jgi:hypothetical protein
MSPKRLPDEPADTLVELLKRTGDVELLTLKAHLWIEVRLEELLRARLKLDEAHELPRLTFYQLAGVALAGFDHALALTQEVNRLRNAFAHEFEVPDRIARMRRFAERVGADPWPDEERLQPYVYALALATVAGLITGIANILRQYPQPPPSEPGAITSK